ncbi:MAG: hypothetical protein HWN65_12360 [Candidatus Helarchaeota archaeon]|nr:hypothetical protein [Candidatus Helarchaeota archaeon]
MSRFQVDFNNLDKEETSNLRRSGILSIFCGVIPLILMITIYGGVAFLLLVDETSPLFETIGFFYINLYPFVGVGVGILLFLVVFLGLRTIVRQTKTRKLLLNLTLIFVGLSVPISLISYFLLGCPSSISLLFYWAPFGMLVDWNELFLNPSTLTWAILTNIIILGAIITLGVLLIILDRKSGIHKKRGFHNFEVPAIMYLSQITIYIFQFLFLLELHPSNQQSLVFYMLFIGVLSSIGFIILGLTLRKPTPS